MSIRLKLANRHLDEIKEFINHNLSLGYIHELTTVSELLAYIERIQKEYIPMIEETEKRYNLKDKLKEIF